MAQAKKYKITIAIFLVLVSVAGIFVWQWKSFVKEKEWIQTLKHSSEPDLMAYTFLRYLRESKLDLAKELVIPEQRERIERWFIGANHKAFDCTSPYWGFNQVIASGGGNSKEIDQNTILQSDSYTCNFNGISMSVSDVIVHYDGSAWVITNWSAICETTSSKAETCYQ